MARIVGGGNLVKFYTVTNTSGGWAIGATAVFECSDQINTDVSIDDTGVHTLTIEQIQDDATLNTFLETYARPSASSSGTPEDILKENGEQILGAANTGTPLLAIVKGGTQTSGETKVFAAVVTMGRSSGSWSQSGNTYNRPSLVAVSQPVEATTATIASTYFSSFMVTPEAASLNNSTRKYGAVFYN
ncbi:MAG: hypothetical protein FGM24_11570 [Candidatus Kapabacteria bacterium]|nr:hypothetical protein [Candidatus Kapabacteria bacterium]